MCLRRAQPGLQGQEKSFGRGGWERVRCVGERGKSGSGLPHSKTLREFVCDTAHLCLWVSMEMSVGSVEAGHNGFRARHESGAQ